MLKACSSKHHTPFKSQDDNALNDSTVVIALTPWRSEGIPNAISYLSSPVQECNRRKSVIVTYCSLCRTGEFRTNRKRETRHFGLVGMDISMPCSKMLQQKLVASATGAALTDH